MDHAMKHSQRTALQEIASELGRLQFEAAALGEEFLAFLISSAADEARDELRDDGLMRREVEAANAETGRPDPAGLSSGAKSQSSPTPPAPQYRGRLRA